MMNENTQTAKTILTDAGMTDISIIRSVSLWEMHVARLVSNLSWCYIQQALASSNTVTSKRVPVTSGSLILAKIGESDIETVRENTRILFRKADEVLRKVPCYGNEWWEIAYRQAQLLQLRLEPQEAMREIDHALHYTKQSWPLYDPDQESEAAIRQIHRLVKEIKMVLQHIDKDYFTRIEQDGKPQGMLSAYLEARGLTRLATNHPRIPMSAVREEMLAVRLLAATELSSPVIRAYPDGTRVRLGEEIVILNPKEESTKLLNEILSTVSQPPLNLFPASGSGERVPPISVHLLAFYFQTCLSDSAMEKFGIQEFCEKVTGGWLSDDAAYAVATHGFVEVENAHNPRKGHAKKFGVSAAGGCMPCTFRLLRSGHDEWGSGLRQAAHFGMIEWIAFCLNRLICGIDDKTVEGTILEVDGDDCNAIMHAANDTFSGFSGLSVQLMVHATAFSISDFHDKTRAIRRVLNTGDRHGYAPALVSAFMENSSGVYAFATLGARLWDESVNTQMPRNEIEALEANIDQIGSGNDPHLNNAIRVLQTRSNEKEPCSFCGNPPTGGMERLLTVADATEVVIAPRAARSGPTRSTSMFVQRQKWTKMLTFMPQTFQFLDHSG